MYETNVKGVFDAGAVKISSLFEMIDFLKKYSGL